MIKLLLYIVPVAAACITRCRVRVHNGGSPCLRDMASFLELTGCLVGRIDWGLIRSEGLIGTILCTLQWEITVEIWNYHIKF